MSTRQFTKFLQQCFLFSKWQFLSSSCSSQNTLFLSHLTFNPPANLVRPAFRMYLQPDHFLFIALVSPILSRMGHCNSPSQLTSQISSLSLSRQQLECFFENKLYHVSLLRISIIFSYNRHYNGLQDPP